MDGQTGGHAAGGGGEDAPGRRAAAGRRVRRLRAQLCPLRGARLLRTLQLPHVHAHGLLFQINLFLFNYFY